MTMGEETNGESQSRLIIQSAKKLYGTIQDLAIQIDSLSSRCLDVEDLFSNELQSKRLAVKECCENLFNLSPKTYGVVAREKLWRLALYDAVSRARRVQRDRPWTPAQLDLVKTHLQGGIGTLQLYIMKLKSLCDSPNDPVAVRTDDFDSLIDELSIDTNNKTVVTPGSQERSWITDLVHLCVINIGDLYRYLKEMHAKANDEDLVFYANFYLNGAQKQYSQAFLLRPDSGLAFNQLGNLFCDLKGGLQSAYYLLYSVQSTNAYEGAYANLRQLLDRKIVQFARLPASIEPKPMDTLVNNILSLMYYFLYENTHLQNYERHCQEALTNFNERLVTCDPEMDEKFLFQLASICVMIVWRLQAINSVHTSAAVAFGISVFCQLINHLTGILEQHAHVVQIQIVSALPSPLPSEGAASEVGSKTNEEEPELMNLREGKEDNSEIEQNEEGSGHHTHRALIVPKRRKRGRGRRFRTNSESDSDDMSDYGTPDFLYSDDDDEDNDNNSENSDENENWSEDEDEEDDLDFNESGAEEDEKLSQRDIDGSECSFKGGNKAFDSSSSNGHSDTSGSGRRRKEVTSVSTADAASLGLPILENVSKEKLAIDYEDLSKCRAQVESLLIALSPFLRWIQATPVIKDALAANAEKSFLEKLCSLLNLLISQNWPMEMEGVTLEELKRDWETLCEGAADEKGVFMVELEEDRSMLGIPQMKEFVKDLKIKHCASNDALIVRLGRTVAFGSWMVQTESFSVLYSQEETNFFVPTPQTLKAYLLDSKLKRLKERLGTRKSDDLDKLSRAYNEMKLRSSDKGPRRRDRDRRDRNREEGGSNRRRRYRRRKGPPCKDPIYAVVDLEAILNRFRDVKRIAAHKKFIVVVPNSVWKTLDMLKDSNEEGSLNARTAFRWLEAAFGRKHPGFVLHKDQHKMKINFPYPKDPVDVDAWEYFDMMEYCNYLMGTLQKNKSRSNEAYWGDVRDKCRVFFLTGHEDLLNTKIPRSFDPVKIARNVGIYVDYVAPYPGLGRGKKWKSVANSNG